MTVFCYLLRILSLLCISDYFIFLWVTHLHVRIKITPRFNSEDKKYPTVCQTELVVKFEFLNLILNVAAVEIIGETIWFP